MFNRLGKFSSCEPKLREQVLCQHIWNNKHIALKLEHKFSQIFFNSGIKQVVDLYDPKVGFKPLQNFIPLDSKQVVDLYDPKVGFKPLQNFILLDSKEYNQQYLHWFSLLNCIPSSWVKILKSETTDVK